MQTWQIFIGYSKILLTETFCFGAQWLCWFILTQNHLFIHIHMTRDDDDAYFICFICLCIYISCWYFVYLHNDLKHLRNVFKKHIEEETMEAKFWR